MTDEESEALVERVALGAINRVRAKWKIAPVDTLGRVSPEEREDYLERARAALAVIEPVVREDERSPKRMRASFERGFPKEGGA